MAKKVAEFFSLHLLGQNPVINEDIINSFPMSLLYCTESGQVRGDIEDARAIFEENYDSLTILKNQHSNIPEIERKQKAIEWFRGKVFSGRKQCDLNARHLLNGWIDELLYSGCFWWSQEGIFNHWLMFRDYRSQNRSLPVTIALWEYGTANLGSHVEWIRNTCNAGRIVLVLDVTGTGMVSSSENCYNEPVDIYGSIHKLGCELIWMGDSLAAIRVYDVIRALDLLIDYPGIDSEDIQIYSFGRNGVYGQLAALLDSRIKHVEVVEGIKSYTKLVGSRYYDLYDILSVIIPGILKYFDLPDIEDWIK
jgi:hypothetical protein